MTQISGLCLCAPPLRAMLLASLLVIPFSACHTDELTDAAVGDLTNPPGLADPVSGETPSFSSSFKGGIPIGMFNQPTSAFGDRFNGAMRNEWPPYLLKELAAIKSRGGRVVLMFAGNERHYKDRNGHFDLGKWKARIDRFKSVNFTSYIKDGTVLGHYLIDEPNDAANWRGKPVPASVLEEMARYSKQRWPDMPTIVRTDPGYLGASHRYLDAAWAQYLHRRGPAADYIRRVVAEAQKKGLGLVVGMNVLKGGPNKSPMTANQLKEWGSTLLSGSHPCAFISWTYDNKYISRSDVAAAMSHLAGKARTKTATSCRRGGRVVAGAGSGSGAAGGGGGRGSDAGSSAGGDSGSAGKSSAISLKARGQARKGHHRTTLTWAKAKGSTVSLYRNGFRVAKTKNDGHHVDVRRARGRGTYVYKVCQNQNSGCSKGVRVVIR